MQQRTFGKRGLAANARTSSPTHIKRPAPPNPAQSYPSQQSASGPVPPHNTAPILATGLYIPEIEPKSESPFGKGIRKGYEALIGLAILFALVATGIAMCQPSDADREKSAQLSAANKEKGFHCLSGWDGSHIGLVRSVKNYMRDPNSFQHVKTVITPVRNGKHSIVMEYRGRNGFGGMNVQVAVGVVSNADCRLLEWSDG